MKSFRAEMRVASVNERMAYVSWAQRCVSLCVNAAAEAAALIEAQAAWAKWRAEMRDLGYTREEIAEMMAEDSEWTAMRACDPVKEGAAPAQGAWSGVCSGLEGDPVQEAVSRYLASYQEPEEIRFGDIVSVHGVCEGIGVSISSNLHGSGMADEDNDDAGRTALKLEMTHFNGKMGLVTEAGGEGRIPPGYRGGYLSGMWARANEGMFKVRMFGFAHFLTLNRRNLKRLPAASFPNVLAGGIKTGRFKCDWCSRLVERSRNVTADTDGVAVSSSREVCCDGRRWHEDGDWIELCCLCDNLPDPRIDMMINSWVETHEDPDPRGVWKRSRLTNECQNLPSRKGHFVFGSSKRLF